MTRGCRISLAVHEDTREEWKEAAANDSHVDSMAQLIRTSVTDDHQRTDLGQRSWITIMLVTALWMEYG